MRTVERLFFVLLVMLSLTAMPTGAHPLLQNTLVARREPAGWRVTVTASVEEICVAQNVPANPFGVTDDPALAKGVAQHGQYLLQHLSVASGANRLTGRVVSVTPPAEFDQPENTFYQYELEYPTTGSAGLTFSQSVLQDKSYAPGVPWDVSYRVSLEGPGPTTEPRLLPSHTSLTLAAAGSPTGGWQTFRDYLWHGIWHILTGYDHLLFVSALVLATRSFWEMFKVIAAFTCAHTLTLALSVFNLVRLPSTLVEPVIALSIVFVALENVWRPDRAQSNLRLAVAFGFGLVHGLGFAGGLLDAMAGLPAGGVWVALGGFSLGVELGHQVVVLPLFGILLLARHRFKGPMPQTWLRWGSGLVATGGAVFLVLAVQEQFFGGK